MVIKFVRILQSRMEDRKKEEKCTRVLRSTFKEIKRDKEAKTITETDLKEAELRWIKGNKVLGNHRFKSLETVIRQN